MRAWQRMLSGRRLDLVNPASLDIEIEDIAHGLSRVARWNGQTIGDHPFSVAQHSLLVEHIFTQSGRECTNQWKLAALLHDAPEYVIGDMISPFKAVLGDDYKSYEKSLQRAIHLRFGLPADLPEDLLKRIKEADKIAAWLEATRLAGFQEQEALTFFGQKPENFLSLDLSPKDTNSIKSLFLNRFLSLSVQ
ncbi:MAG: YfbR-like 5'-deoxynucleotidase [Alphaproteobacteria bacterium]